MKGTEKENWLNDPEGQARKESEVEDDSLLGKSSGQGLDLEDEGQKIMEAEYKRYMKAISGKK